MILSIIISLIAGKGKKISFWVLGKLRSAKQKTGQVDL